MKLLLITHYFPAHRGGIELVAEQIAKHLSTDHAFEITWFASDCDAPPIDNANIEYIPAPATNWIESHFRIPYPIWYFSAIKNLWVHVKTTDIIHLHDYIYLSNLIAFIFAKISRTPIVITQHIGFIPYKSIFLRSLVSFLNNTVGHIMLKKADKVIFISHVVQHYFESRINFRRKPLMIPNGVDNSIFYPVSEGKHREIRKYLSLPIDKPLFIFVGRFVEKKGLKILKKLALSSTSIHWAFAGNGHLDPEKWNYSNVTVFRHLQSTSLATLYQTADLLVLPSMSEGFPLVVQEAMACGTPALTSQEIAQSYKPAETLILTPESPDNRVTFPSIEEWIKVIKQLKNDPLKLNYLRSHVSTFAQTNWCWKTSSLKYAESLKEATNIHTISHQR